MKYKNYNIIIPGASDILFLKDFNVNLGESHYNLARSTSGTMSMTFYELEDLEWLYDWRYLLEHFCYKNYNYSQISEVARKFIKREITIQQYDKNVLVGTYKLYNVTLNYIQYINWYDINPTPIRAEFIFEHYTAELY